MVQNLSYKKKQFEKFSVQEETKTNTKNQSNADKSRVIKTLTLLL